MTTLPRGAKTIGVKQIFKTKYNEKWEIEKHKARSVAKGYSQKKGVDYKEGFAPVARWDIIRTIVTLTTLKVRIVHQLDVKNVFLYGEIKETIFIEQP